MTQPGGRHDSGRLDTALDRVRPNRRRWRVWAAAEPALRGVPWELFRSELRHGPAERQDELLAAVVRIARHDTEAVGVVVACLVPGLRARIARYAPGLPRDDAWSVAVGGVCEAIHRGRPATFVASRLLDVAKRHLQRAVTVEAVWAGHADQLPDLASDSRADEPSAGLILITAVNAGVLSRPDAWLLHVTLIVGHSLPWAAGRLGIGYETAKKRRQRAEAHWRAWWVRGISAPEQAYTGVGHHPRSTVAAAGGEVA